MKPFATYEQKKRRESGILDGIDQSDLFPHCVLYMGWNQMKVGGKEAVFWQLSSWFKEVCSLLYCKSPAAGKKKNWWCMCLLLMCKPKKVSAETWFHDLSLPPLSCFDAFLLLTLSLYQRHHDKCLTFIWTDASPFFLQSELKSFLSVRETLSVSDLHILKTVFLLCTLKTAITNANLWSSFKRHLTLNVRKPSKMLQSLFVQSESRVKVIGWSFEWWSAGTPHLLFPLISLENLVKIGRYRNEMVSPPVAQIPHCFHSCLARRPRLKVGGGLGWWGGDQAAEINSCVKMRNEKQKG